MENHLTLDDIYLLEQSLQGYNISELKHRKITLYLTKLKRDAYLDEQCCITVKGKELLESLLLEEENIKLNKIEKTDDDFTKFWKAFPPNNTIKVDGKILFKGEIDLKANKEGCRVKLHTILSEGEYTIDDIIKALNYEVHLKIEHSIKSKDNKLRYLVNSYTWLHQRKFENFMDEARENDLKPFKKQTNWDTIA